MRCPKKVTKMITSEQRTIGSLKIPEFYSQIFAKLISLNLGQFIFISAIDIERRKISSKYLQNILFATPELKGRVRIKAIKDSDKRYLGYKAIRIA